MKEPEYKQKTYDLTLHVANTLVRLNPDMTFCYVSGAGTDSSEKGSSMWARVKGKTENDLLKLPFKKAYMFRPGIIEPTTGLKNTLKFLNIFARGATTAVPLLNWTCHPDFAGLRLREVP